MASQIWINQMKVSKPASRQTGARAVVQRGPPRKSRVQPGPLMFVNITDPAESKRADNRQAVRKFVMVQHSYKQKARSHSIIGEEEQQSDGDSHHELVQEPKLAYNRESSTSEYSLASEEASEGISIQTTKKPLQCPDVADGLLPSSLMTRSISSQLDPFDTHPAKIDMRVHQLLDMYVNTEDFFPETKPFSRDGRRKLFLPLACSSKAAFHVLIAVSAAATSDSRFQSLIWFHHNQAVRALNKALENGQGLEDSTIYTVRGLLQIAVAMQSHAAVSMHLQGMVAVVEKHGSPYNMEPLARKCVSFLAYWACEDEIDILGAKKMSQFPFSAFLKRLPIDELLDEDVGLGFHELANTSLLSNDLLVIFQQIRGLSVLSKKARETRLTRREIQALVTGICRGGQRLFSMKDYCMSPLEICCRHTTFIHFNADIVPFDDDGLPIIRQTEKTHAILLTIDAQALVNDWPNVCLWIALTSGAFAIDEHWAWFRTFLKDSCNRLMVKTWEDVTSVSNAFLPMSCDQFIQRCKGFWQSCMMLNTWVDGVLLTSDQFGEFAP